MRSAKRWIKRFIREPLDNADGEEKVLVNVAGLVAIEMEVHDSGGNPISQIDNSTVGPRHVAIVENIGKHPRGIRVVASLPHGMTQLEFVDGGNSSAKWNKHVLNVPCNSPRRLRCDLSRKSPGRNEPLQCDEVHEAHGSSTNWHQLTSNAVPFSITIDVI
jgi:hypothetical protein